MPKGTDYKNMSQSQLDTIERGLTTQIEAFVSAAKGEGRDLTESEASRVDALLDERDLIRNCPMPRQAAPVQPAPGTSGLAGSAGGMSNGGFSDVGEFMAALHRKIAGEGYDERLQVLAASTSISGGGSGGFAVPEQFVVQAFNQIESPLPLLSNVDRVPMISDKVTAPSFVDDDHNTSAPYGISWKQLGENEDFGVAEDVALRSISLEAHKSGALFYVSNEWLQDAHPAMRARLTTIFNSSLQWHIEDRLWNGTGAGEALGVLNADSVLQIDKEVGQAATTIVLENILKMYARAIPGSEGRLIWACNKTCLPQLATMSVIIGTSGGPVGLLQPDATAPLKLSILGRPLYVSEHLPALGTSGDIMLVDPLLYSLGERGSIILEASPHHRFQYDQTTYRAKVRFDGQPQLTSTFTPQNGDTCGWAVKVETR